MSLFKKGFCGGLKYYPNLLKTVIPRVLNRNFRDFSLINDDFKHRNSPYAGLASAAVISIYLMDARSQLI
jgi:hypothetical protein